MSAGHVISYHLVTVIIFKLSGHGRCRKIPEICTEITIFVLQNLYEFYIITSTDFI